MKAYNLRILITSSLFLLFVQPLLAEDSVRYYDIEMVVFENLQNSPENNEIWPAAKQLEVPENAAVLGRKYTGKLPAEYNPRLLFDTLPVKDYQLNEEVEALKASEQYRLLLHTGWRQPGLPKKQAISVYFKHAVAENYGAEQTPAQSAETTASPAALEAAAEPEVSPATGPVIANLEGLVTIVLSRYLHLNVEMLYKRNPEDTEVDMFDTSFLEDSGSRDTVYYLNQTRRMRSKETHYIDHPIIGMLVRITPYEVMSKAPAANRTRTN